MCLGETHVCLGETHVCLGETHVCLGETHVCLGETIPVLYPYFSLPVFFPTLFFSGSCLCFFKIPFFPPIENVHPPRVFLYPSFISLFVSPCFFSNPFFMGLAYVFSKSPFSPIDFFYPLRALQTSDVFSLPEHHGNFFLKIAQLFFHWDLLMFSQNFSPFSKSFRGHLTLLFRKHTK